MVLYLPELWGEKVFYLEGEWMKIMIVFLLGIILGSGIASWMWTNRCISYHQIRQDCVIGAIVCEKAKQDITQEIAIWQRHLNKCNKKPRVLAEKKPAWATGRGGP